MNAVQQVEDAVLAWASLEPAEVVLIAVSGGLDSSLLARVAVPLLTSRGSRPRVVHVDHGLRGPESEEDARWVESLARELDCPVEVRRVKVSPELRRRVGHEAAARAARYQALAESSRSWGDAPVLLAHHEDDQLETLLIREEEGLAEDRIVGMRSRVRAVRRPLLGLPKAVLRRAAADLGASHREDSSNADPRFRRNRIRASVLPSLSPSVRRDRLARAAASRLAADEVGRRAEALLRRAVLPSSSLVPSLDGPTLAAAPSEVATAALQRVLPARLLGDRPPSRRALAALLGAARLGGPARELHLGSGWSARVEAGVITFEPMEVRASKLPPVSPPPRPLTPGRAIDWPGGWSLGCRTLPVDRARALLSHPQSGRAFALFDRGRLGGPLRVAPAAVGARFRPFGLDGTRRVRHMYIDARVPRSVRTARPTVQSVDDRILWLPGLHAAHLAPLTHSSDEALVLYTSRSPNGGPTAPRSLLHAESA